MEFLFQTHKQYVVAVEESVDQKVENDCRQRDNPAPPSATGYLAGHGGAVDLR